MKNLLTVSLMIVLWVGTATLAAAQIPCALGNTPSSPGSTVALGPLMYYFLSTYQDVAAAVINGLAAWKGTHAQGRILGWNGQVTASDCPSGIRQISAWSFANSSCMALRVNLQTPYRDYVAFVDAFWTTGSGMCPYPSTACATGSIVLNTDIARSTNPGPAQLDIQRIIVHEFGHMFGLAHANGLLCEYNGASPLAACAVDPGRNSVRNPMCYGDTCLRTLSHWDVLQINGLFC